MNFETNLPQPYVLGIDRDKSYANGLGLALRNEGYDYRHFTDYRSALPSLTDPKCRAAVICRTLEGESGLQLAKMLRGDSSTAKLIIILVAHVYDEYEVIEGLDAGVDDYMGKPLASRELVYRFKAIEKRRYPVDSLPSQERPRAVNTKFKIDGDTAFFNNNPLTLTRSEFEILQLLQQAPDRIFSRVQLLEGLTCSVSANRGSSHATDNCRMIDVHINSIRAKLKKFDAAPSIKTIRGIGYLLSEVGADRPHNFNTGTRKTSN